MITIVLANPQMGENIGAAARAMCNFGISDLRLVNPRDGWPNANAVATASGALDHITNIQVYETLSDAIADTHFAFATTSRRRDLVKAVYSPEAAMAEAYSRITQKQKIAFVFGAERTGLLNDEMSKCQATITFPINPEFPSLNLAQAVLLICYEWMRVSSDTSNHTKLETGDSFPAQQKDVQMFISRLIEELEDKRFFRTPELKRTMIRNIENIFTRADITDQELKTLHGILSALRGNKIQK